MESSSYLSLVNKYKYAILLIVLATLAAAFFLVKKLPEEYVSSTEVATGIVDASRHILDRDNTPQAQTDEITREFSNLTEIIKLKKLIDNVSYQLIIHDLSSPTPFRKLNHQFKNLSRPAVESALRTYKEKLQNGEPLSLFSKNENGLNQLLISMSYDERSIRKALEVTRNEESDFITITYTSENPQLSAYVVNVLCKEFLDYYSVNIKRNESNAVAFLSNLLAEKRAALDKEKNELQQYKIKNNILNLDEQSKSIFSEILAYNDKKIQAEKDIAAYQGAIKGVMAKFDPKKRGYIEATISPLNQAITNSETQLHALNDIYVHSGFNPKYKKSLDSLQEQLNEQINNGSDKYIQNPLIAKDDLVRQRMTLEVSADLAKYSVEAIDKEVANLKAQFSRLVPFDATVKTYEFDIDIAGKEYLDVLNKYNTTNLQSNFSIKLMQVEPATPDTALPSKKLVLIALCGVISLVICLIVLFVLYYLDDRIKSPATLVSRTQLPLLGSLGKIPGAASDLLTLWEVENRTKMKQYKELLRSVRFEIDQELKGEKVLGITSLGEGEGKTLLAMSLAYAYAAINKKVLVIDGNFNNPTITNATAPKAFVEDYFKNNVYLDRNNNITVLGNRGGDFTLLEINDEKYIQQSINELKTRYDILIIDMPALNSLNKPKEWILFTNKAVAVFENDTSLLRNQSQYVDYLKGLHHKFAGWVINKASS